MANIKNAVKLGVFTLAIMNVTAVVSLRGLPAEAVYGMSSAFYYLFAAIVFSDSDVTCRRGTGCHVSRQARAVCSAGVGEATEKSWASLPSGYNGLKVQSGILPY